MSDAPGEYERVAAEEVYYPELTSDARNWAVLCHLAGLFGAGVPLVGHVLGPLVVWLIQRNEHPFIDDQGKEAVNFQISMVIYGIIGALLVCVVVGIVILPVLYVLDVILVIVAAVNASRGEAYRYPMTIRLIS